MLFKTVLGLLMSVLHYDFTRLQEVVKRHSAVLLVLWLSELLALLLDSLDDLGRGLSALILCPLFRLFLGDYQLAEALELLIVLKFVVFARLGQMRQVEAELDDQGVRRLAHLDGLNLTLSLRAGRELERLELAEHLHVALELELRGLDNVLLGL